MKNRSALLIVTLIVAWWSMPALAQRSDVVPYGWEAGDLALVYPAGWDTPLPGESDGQITLQLAQTLVNDPARPPAIPFITLTLIPLADTPSDLNALLLDALTVMSITPGAPIMTTFARIEGVMVSGSSADGLLYGTGRAAQLSDGRTLVIVGRGLAEQRAMLESLIDIVANSIVPGATSQPQMPTYGVLWFTGRTPADGDSAFLNLAGVAYGAENRLYAVDTNLGVIQLDAQTGAVLAVFPFENLALPADITIDSSGRVYIADTLCNCLLVLSPEGEWGDSIGEFAADAPRSVAAAPDGKLYATDLSETNVLIQVFDGDSQSTIPLRGDVLTQPLLAIDRSGRVLALTESGMVLGLEGDQFVPLYPLFDLPPLFNDFAVDASNGLAVATQSRGIMAFNAAGNAVDYIGRIVATSPLPGELVSPRGLAFSADNTLYFADSDGTFGAITAMSTRVQPGRTGATEVSFGLPVQGKLDDLTTRQTWMFDGTEGQRITISAVDASRTGEFNVALRLLAPDGSEAAYNDDQESGQLFGASDAQIAGYTLKVGGTYIVVVERVGGEGTYTLGIQEDRVFELNEGGATTLRSELSDVFPAERWVFEGKAGQVFTLTMSAESGDLDPVLRLLNARGQVLAENDDAADTALGPNAQLLQVRLPVNGAYTIEAARFQGSGRYTLIVVTTS